MDTDIICFSQTSANRDNQFNWSQSFSLNLRRAAPQNCLRSIQFELALSPLNYPEQPPPIRCGGGGITDHERRLRVLERFRKAGKAPRHDPRAHQTAHLTLIRLAW